MRYPKKSGGLLERTFADARHLLQLLAVLERAMLIAKRHDVLGERFVEAGDSREQRRRRRVQIGSDGVDAVFDNRVELSSQQRLIEVVLILANPDGLGLDAHELGERILETARNRDCATQ